MKPVFFVRDPSKVQDFIHSQKRLPDTGLRSNEMQWDVWTLSPEGAHQVRSSGSSTTSSRFRGSRNLTGDEAARIAGEDGDHHRRDLHRAIESGDAPEWAFCVQVMPFEDAASYRFNPFDLTKVWPKSDSPLLVGNIVGHASDERVGPGTPTGCAARAARGLASRQRVGGRLGAGRSIRRNY